MWCKLKLYSQEDSGFFNSGKQLTSIFKISKIAQYSGIIHRYQAKWNCFSIYHTRRITRKTKTCLPMIHFTKEIIIIVVYEYINMMPFHFSLNDTWQITWKLISQCTKESTTHLYGIYYNIVSNKKDMEWIKWIKLCKNLNALRLSSIFLWAIVTVMCFNHFFVMENAVKCNIHHSVFLLSNIFFNNLKLFY